MHLLIAFAIGVLAGGFGGYKYGASVERRAAAVLAAAGSAAGKAASKL